MMGMAMPSCPACGCKELAKAEAQMRLNDSVPPKLVMIERRRCVACGYEVDEVSFEG